MARTWVGRPPGGLTGRPLHAVFNRAPLVLQTGPAVQVLARVGGPGPDDTIVAVRQGALLATAFHPEVSGDDPFHELLVGLAVQARRSGRG